MMTNILWIHMYVYQTHLHSVKAGENSELIHHVGCGHKTQVILH